MYFNDSGEQLRECDSEREYFVSAEIYISNAAGATLRKYKKPGDEARPRDKPSWLGLGKGLSTESGHWRPAICKLTKEANVERCLLNIYVDENILFQTVYIHLLRQTDIRPADNSLFFRKDCVVIKSTEKQKWVACDTVEPVYLQISRPGLRNLWISLLRSYAIPEIYGRWLNRLNAAGIERDGGSYRIWREVQLTVAQGRNLGTNKSEDIENEAEFKDIDVYCEVRLNDATYARTTTKKGQGHPEWHESFLFSDLPPFESLEIVIFKEKKVLRPSVLGKVFIDLVTFRRAELLEGWYPVHYPNFSPQHQSGDLRLKIRVNEEIILPHHCYEGLQQALNKRNCLLWMQDLENTLRIRTLSQHLINLAIVQETIVQHIQEAAEWEVEKASHQTIFRGNTIFTKTMEKCIAWYGSSFLEASIGSVLRRLLSEKIAIEVDPVHSGKNAKDVGRHVELLIHWCKEFWEQIYAVRADCPNELRSLLDRIRMLVEEHGRKTGLAAKAQQQRPWQSVSAFIFLRFIVPGILHPHLFGLCSGLPDPAIQRSLKLIAKVIQSMANLNTADQREISMGRIRDFIKDNMPHMMDYLATVSTPKSSMYSSFRFEDRNDRYVVNNLVQKKATLSTLERESVPASPHYIDPSREMAIITSNVIRHSRDPNNKNRPRVFGDQNLEYLCSTCFDVEEEALHRVNELATRLSQERRRAFASAAWGRNKTLSTKEPFASTPSLHSGHQETFPSNRPAFNTPPQVVLQPVIEIPPGRENLSLNPISAGYSHSEKADPVVTDIGGSGLQKPIDPSTSEFLDDGAKRKRSFIRGIFGGEPRNSGRPRY